MKIIHDSFKSKSQSSLFNSPRVQRPLRFKFKTLFLKMLLRRLTVIISTKIRSVSILTRFKTMQDGYVEINKVPTHIFTWGQWVEDEFKEENKEIVLIITGNPGLPGFYTKFCSSLYNELDKKVPIWVIGHAG